MTFKNWAQAGRGARDIRQCLMEACSARDRLIFYLMHPDTVLGIADIGKVETKTGTPILVTPELAQATNGNLNTIGKMLGLSRERIRQVSQETFLKIRRRFPWAVNWAVSESRRHRRNRPEKTHQQQSATSTSLGV